MISQTVFQLNGLLHKLLFEFTVNTPNERAMTSDIHLHADHRPRSKVPPQLSSIVVPFSYTPSPDGTDENLLILLHGLGEFYINQSEFWNTPLTRALLFQVTRTSLSANWVVN